MYDSWLIACFLQWELTVNSLERPAHHDTLPMSTSPQKISNNQAATIIALNESHLYTLMISISD